MKLFSSRPLLLFSSSSSSRFPSSLSLQVSNFSAVQNNPSSSNRVASYRRHEEDSKNVRVSVWWDFENCGVPAGANVFKVAANIFAAVRANGIKGSIQITAFGDMLQLSRSYQEALSSTGIRLTHIPRDADGKISADRSLLVDLMYWVSENPPPAHLFLISGDKGFSNSLHRLRMKNYNILLATTYEAPGVLCGVATIMWHWQDLAAGQNFAGKHFNRPPDGLSGSWYGHYKTPLEDPFPVTVQPACSQMEASHESGSDSKLRPVVPRKILRQICKILNSHPEGISIMHLREELAKTNVSVEKDLYGHKKFSRLLLSLPHILNLEDVGKGQYMIRGIIPQSIEPIGQNSGSSTDGNSGDWDATNPSLYGTDKSISEPLDKKDVNQNITTKEACGKDKFVTSTVDGKKLVSTPEPEVEKSSSEEQIRLGELQGPSEPGKKVVEVFDGQSTDGLLPPVGRQDPSPNKVVILEKIRRWWFGGESRYEERSDEECIASDNSLRLSHQTDAKCSSGDTVERIDNENKCAKSTNHNVGLECPVSSCSINNISDGDKVSTTSPDDGSDVNSGFFSQIVKWCQSWKSSKTSDKPSELTTGRLNHKMRLSGGNELFTTESFWSTMEAFMNTARGSIIVSQSMTREELARNLQKEGPTDLSSVSESDLLHLVDLLISEKKWVEECSSQRPVFKLVQTIADNASVDQPNGSNGLGSVFMNRPLKSGSSTKQLECERDKRHQKIPRTISVSPTGKQPVRNALEDCQKLVNEILDKHPEGFNIGYLKKSFHYRYGYYFDLRELGYDKLSSLLEALPGIKVESSHIFRSGYSSDDYSLDITIPDLQEETSSNGRDHSNAEWGDLGPVANDTSKSKPKQVLSTSSEFSRRRQSDTDYEPLALDDSDSEEDTLTDSSTVGQAKRQNGDDDSLLLHILDSWCGEQKGKKIKGKAETIDLRNDPKSLDDSCEAPFKNETFSGKNERKENLRKTYSFVAEPAGDNDRDIGNIIGTLKKSRMHNS